jgi:hypothetical protein
MDEISISDKLAVRNSVFLTRENIKAIIEDFNIDPDPDTSLFEDIQDYMDCQSYYLNTWSNYELDYNPQGFLELKLFWFEKHCATIVFKKITGTYISGVDWVKEGF